MGSITTQAKDNISSLPGTKLKSYTKEDVLIEKDSYKLATYIFEPINTSSSDSLILIESTTPNRDGQVSIQDIIYGESSVVNSATKSGPWNTIKYVSLKLFYAVPVVGDVSETCMDIYEGIKAAYSDMNFDQYTNKNTAVWTRYRTRPFKHVLSVYDNGTWIDMGYSESKYYYKCQTMDYPVVGSDTYATRTLNYTKTNGFDPTAIRKAPLYKNYTQLSDTVYEYWLNWGGSRKFYETYY